MKNNFVGLMILDGWGIGRDYEGNAALKANTPNLDALLEKYPHVPIEASGLHVGLPDGQMGNSEVGHMNLGAGRIIYQSLTKITKEIEDGDFFEKKELLDAIEHAKKNNSKVHLMGLMSKGGVHSHMKHLFGLLELGKKNNFNDMYVHAFMDGRDVDPKSGQNDIAELVSEMNEKNIGQLATVIGRYYAMDRDNRWDRVERAYKAMVNGDGIASSDAVVSLKDSYSKDITDEFVDPIVMQNENKPVAKIEDGDSIIFFNFRPDRARQITRAIVDENFDGFDRGEKLKDIYFACMTQYDKTIENVDVVYGPETINNTFGEYISQKGLKQLRIAETEKYAHVTFFFNGGVEEPNEGEDRELISSPKVATYDLQPEMSAIEVKEKAVNLIKSEKYDTMVLNFANPDMVGHTGIMEAAMKAIETVDSCVKEVVEAVESIGGKLIITADHGNLEQMLDFETGDPMTAHTTNPVHCLVLGAGDVKLRNDGKLADIAPTLFDMMDIEKPSEMTGESLIIK